MPPRFRGLLEIPSPKQSWGADIASGWNMWKPVHGQSSLEANSLSGIAGEKISFCLWILHHFFLKLKSFCSGHITKVWSSTCHCSTLDLSRLPLSCSAHSLPHAIGTKSLLSTDYVLGNMLSLAFIAIPTTPLGGYCHQPTLKIKKQGEAPDQKFAQSTQLVTEHYFAHSTTSGEAQWCSRFFYQVTWPACSPMLPGSGSYFPTWHLGVSHFLSQSSVSSLSPAPSTSPTSFPVFHIMSSLPLSLNFLLQKLLKN